MNHKLLNELKNYADSPEVALLGGYISEHQAKKLLQRSSTWFWELRKGGFPYTKLGGETYYRIQDFIDLLEAGFNKKR